MSNGESRRDRIRNLAEEIIRYRRMPLHNTEVTEYVRSRLGQLDEVSAKTVNTCLHDDPKGRFVRVGPGTWDVKAKE